MGRKKVFDGELVSIGARITKGQMAEIQNLREHLGMKSVSELLRAALERYLRNPPKKFSDNARITNEDERDFHIRIDTCPSFKELGISLNDAISKWEVLDRCSRLDVLMPCSNDECPKREGKRTIKASM